MYYFQEKINRDIPIESVLGMYGLDNKTRGNIHCPDPEHADTKPSATIYTNNNVCRCFSCNKTYRPLDIVMMMEGYSNREFPKACEQLLDHFGLNKGDYGEGEDKYGKKDNDPFPFTNSEMELIGLVEGIKYTEIRFLDEDGEEYAEKIKSPTLYDLYRFGTDDTNRELLQEIVIGKAKDKREELKEGLEWLKGVMEDFEKRDDFEEKLNLYQAHLEYKKTHEKGNINEILPKGMTKEEGLNKIWSMAEHMDDYRRVSILEQNINCCEHIIQKAENIDMTEEEMWTIKPKKDFAKKGKGISKCS